MPRWGPRGPAKCHQAEARGKLWSVCWRVDTPLQGGRTSVSVRDALLRPPQPPWCAGGRLGTPPGWAVPPGGSLASPSAGSRPPPPGRRAGHAAGAGPPAAAGTSLGRTCTRSAPSALGPDRKARAPAQPAPPPTDKGTPLLGPPACRPPTPCPGPLRSLGLACSLHGVPTRTLCLSESPPLSSHPFYPLSSPISVREA